MSQNCKHRSGWSQDPQDPRSSGSRIRIDHRFLLTWAMNPALVLHQNVVLDLAVTANINNCKHGLAKIYDLVISVAKLTDKLVLCWGWWEACCGWKDQCKCQEPHTHKEKNITKLCPPQQQKIFITWMAFWYKMCV